MATSLPNRYNSQNNKRDTSCMYNAAIWKAHRGMQWSTRWYANTWNATKIQMQEQTFWQKLAVHRKSPGGIRNYVERKIQTTSAWGSALFFMTDGHSSKKTFCRMILCSNDNVFSVTSGLAGPTLNKTVQISIHLQPLDFWHHCIMVTQ